MTSAASAAPTLPKAAHVSNQLWGISNKCFALQVMMQFKMDRTASGDAILLRRQTRTDPHGDRDVPVVAIEDLPAFFRQHSEVLGVSGAVALFKHVRMWSRNAGAVGVPLCTGGGAPPPPAPPPPTTPTRSSPPLSLAPTSLQLHHCVPTHLQQHADGTPRVVYGAAGFTRDTVQVWMSGDAAFADVRPSKPAEQPAPQAIIAKRPFDQCLVRVARVWGCMGGVPSARPPSAVEPHTAPTSLPPPRCPTAPSTSRCPPHPPAAGPHRPGPGPRRSVPLRPGLR